MLWRRVQVWEPRMSDAGEHSVGTVDGEMVVNDVDSVVEWGGVVEEGVEEVLELDAMEAFIIEVQSAEEVQVRHL